MKHINYDIQIDFPLPRVLKNTMDEAEELDEAENIEYIHVANAIDVCAKEAYVNGLITKDQWDRLLLRYPI